uniref:Prolactin regulatory element binding n=1 Tax=Calidris pygmaea TaxID=425635 RepID=A0A8C3KA27_9CHAR
MAPRRPAELYRAPFPLYTVRLHPQRPLAITAGGGGAAKTGIRNGVHFLQLEQIGGQLSASLLHSHDTETRATMTMALADDIIAAGQDASCHILRFRLQPPEPRGASDGRNGESPGVAGQGLRSGCSVGCFGGLLPCNSPPGCGALCHGSLFPMAGSGEKGPRRRKGTSPAGQGETQSQSGEVTVESLHSVRTDFSPDALQKAVRFNADASLLVTGGADGFLRLWEFPSMKKTLEFKAHDGEIEDIALGPDNKVVTAGRDFQCCVWQQDQLVTGLRWNENLPGIPDKAYRYQACRFGTVEDDAGALRLYTVQVPHKRERRPPPCYLTKWDGKSFLPLLTRPCGSEVISCLSVSDSGTFLGLGTVTGSVAIHIAFSLQVSWGAVGLLGGWGAAPVTPPRGRAASATSRCCPAEAVLREGGAWHRGDGCGLRSREPGRPGAAGGERGRPAQRGR